MISFITDQCLPCSLHSHIHNSLYPSLPFLSVCLIPSISLSLSLSFICSFSLSLHTHTHTHTPPQISPSSSGPPPGRRSLHRTQPDCYLSICLFAQERPEA